MTARRRNGEGEYASPACLMHEFDAREPAEPRPDPLDPAAVMPWRKAERRRLIAARLATPADERRRWSVQIERFLEQALGDVSGLTVSGYAPFRGEPVLRKLLRGIVARGGRTALPVVLERGKPLQFRAWAPGDPTERGMWDIPVPRARAAIVVPDVVIAPLVGFDRAYFRLGYGGGFFDRTLASMARRPRAIGVGYAQAAIATIYPQPHDIRMDAIVTEQGVTIGGPADRERD
jgi:5-formyltetrahydrofolate cyclo-ligase